MEWTSVALMYNGQVWLTLVLTLVPGKATGTTYK